MDVKWKTRSLSHPNFTIPTIRITNSSLLLLLSNKVISYYYVLSLFYLHSATNSEIKTALYTPSVAASSVKSEHIKEEQLDQRIYTPCCNKFVIDALRILYNPPRRSAFSQEFIDSVTLLIEDYQACFDCPNSLGYLSQDGLIEDGISAILEADISECFRQLAADNKHDMLYCHHAQLLDVRGFMDISCFARIMENESEVLSNQKCLYPLSFIEITKNNNKTIHGKIAQASVYANGNFRLMKYDECEFWIPLMGMIMSEVALQLRVYFLTQDDKHCWRIAEIPLIEFSFSFSNMLEPLVASLHAIHQWNIKMKSILKMKGQDRGELLNTLLPIPNENVYIDKKERKVYKAYDYRSLVGKRKILTKNRRSPKYYYTNSLMQSTIIDIIDFINPKAKNDTFKLIAYDYIEGNHIPKRTSQLFQILQQLLQLHKENLVFGDLKLSNCIFNNIDDNYQAMLIDFDFTRAVGDIYPVTFNIDININDGKRHPDVKPNGTMQVEHDIFALYHICTLFDAENESWTNICKSLETCDVERAVDLFTDCKDTPLRPKIQISSL
jgi:hypothetical protein